MLLIFFEMYHKNFKISVPSTTMAYGKSLIVLALKPIPNQTSAGPVKVMVALPVLPFKSNAENDADCIDPIARIFPKPVPQGTVLALLLLKYNSYSFF